MNTEIWNDIPEFENLYQVSNLGNVKALSKIRKTGRSGSTIKEAFEDSVFKIKYETFCKYLKKIKSITINYYKK